MNEARAGSQKNKFSKIRIAVAFFIAVFADIILLPFEPALPLCTIIDCIVAVILYFILGCPIILLPALIAEALPGIGIFPFWTLVVVSIGAFGTITATGKSNYPVQNTQRTAPIYDEPSSPTENNGYTSSKDPHIIDVETEVSPKE